MREDEKYDILHACHNESCGVHFATKRTTLKILTIGYYWPTLYKYATNYTKRYDKCWRMCRQTKIDEMPLNPQMVLNTI